MWEEDGEKKAFYIMLENHKVLMILIPKLYFFMLNKIALICYKFA